ncbi:alpha beta-hydrolase [Mycena galopus ATCC 62051]|nr:alpha beta-hydrolase [Mycena galopus ATCC 62051]
MALQVFRTIATAVLLTVPLAGAQTSPVVDLGYAQYQGVVNTANNISHFLGIRYAAAPSGELHRRFTLQGPQPPVNMSGIQPAAAEPNECFQAPIGTSAINPFETRASEIVETEDCLFLNVYYPSDGTGVPPAGLPTAIWIHGGGYIKGAASLYNGEDIIAQSNRGVVVVLIQYRLGFLAGAAVKENGALNAGLLDQDFAMRWISKFGGDPSKVTIWGGSAGAGSVLQHVVANGGRTEPPLFRGAITSSTFIPSQYQFNHPIPELLFSEVVAQTNCTSAPDAMACLRAADATTLETANNNINTDGFFGTYTFVPVVDGVFIAQRPTLSLLEARLMGYGEVLLFVTNSFEGTLFVNQDVAITAAQYSLNLFPDFGTTQANTVGALYANLGTELFQVNAVYGESIIICPTYDLLHAFPGRSFKGEFAIPPAIHGNDVPYYFTGGVTPRFNNTQFIDAFAQSFTSFIINLDPNVKVDSTTITPHWNKFDISHTEMLFNMTAGGVPVVHPITTSDALLQRCTWVSNEVLFDHLY